MNILFGVTSGISLYKGLTVIRMLIKAGHDIRVIMTPNAEKMVSRLLYKTISRNDVYIMDFDISEPLAHIRLSDWGDVFAVCPATANTIAKLSNGIADNLLTSTFLAFNRRRVVFPAMNVKMFENKITQDNLDRMRSAGVEVIDPCFGDLACGYTGRGRLPQEDTIFHVIERDTSAKLKGRSYIVTAGGTIEKIDPVRYISNFSSGKMGVETAISLYRNGADVLLVYGNVSVRVPEFIKSIKADSSIEMLEALDRNMTGYDGLFMAAAPADFRVEKISENKIKSDKDIELRLVRNPDILKNITSKYRGKLYVGFALETDDALENAKLKLEEKGLTFIALNTISASLNPLGGDMNQVSLISKKGITAESGQGSKKEIAEWLVEKTTGIGDAGK